MKKPTRFEQFAVAIESVKDSIIEALDYNKTLTIQFLIVALIIGFWVSAPLWAYEPEQAQRILLV